MKKNKLLVLGLIVIMLVGGLALASCGRSGCEGAGTCKIEVKGDDTKGSYCSKDGCMEDEYKKNDYKDGTYKCDC